MRQWKTVSLAICVFGILCSLAGCQKEDRFQTTFPLEEEVVAAALEKVGLPGVISPSETDSYQEGHILYVIRSDTECYDNTENRVFVASIASADQHMGGRVLYTDFDQRIDSEPIQWEDWKKQIVLATMLYGGFEEEEEVYQAFLEKELPEETAFQLDAQLPGGYCRLSYRPRSSGGGLDENGFPFTKRSAFLDVDIYESYEQYQKIREEQERAYEQQQKDKEERERAAANRPASSNA